MSGAIHLARIHGTEEDRVNCPFYFKVGACRHGDTCSRNHNRPPFARTIIIPRMWQNPVATTIALGGDPSTIDKDFLIQSYDDFYFEMFEEFSKYGKVDQLRITENLCDHMLGNVYVKFSDEEEAEAAKMAVHGKYYNNRLINCEYSPVSDFKEAICRQHDDSTCDRGPACNFMHVKPPSKMLQRYLEEEYRFYAKGDYRGRPNHNSNSGGGSRMRSRSNSRNRRHMRDKDR